MEGKAPGRQTGRGRVGDAAFKDRCPSRSPGPRSPRAIPVSTFRSLNFNCFCGQDESEGKLLVIHRPSGGNRRVRRREREGANGYSNEHLNRVQSATKERSVPASRMPETCSTDSALELGETAREVGP